MKRSCFCFLLVIFLVLAPWHLTASQPSEGRVYSQTEHFTFIYEPQDAWAVEEILPITHEVYEQLSTLLSYRPKESIPVLITSRPFQSNGFYSPFPPKIILYITSPSNRFIGSRTTSWLQSLFIHELTHYFHLTAPVGPAKFLTPIFGPDVPAMNSVLMPGWWVEGITTYTESHLAPGGRGSSPTFALTYESPLLENEMWSLSQGGYNSINPPNGRIYTTGYLMVEHLISTYGHEAFTEINRRFASWPFFGMSPAFSQVVGMKPKEMFAKVLEEKLANIPENGTLNEPFSPQVTGDFYLPEITDAGLIGQAYTLDDGDSLIHYMDDTQKTARIADHLALYGTHSSSITSDGSTAFVSFAWEDAANWENFPLAATSFSDLYRYDIPTGTFTQITRKQRLTHPASNNDGTAIVAIEAVGDRWRLVSVDPQSGKTSVLYEREDVSVYEPQFSLDGKQIIYIEIHKGHATLVTLNLETGKTKELWPHEYAEIHQPRFIDNDTVWFASDRDGRLSLYEISLKNGTRYKIMEDPLGITGAILYEDDIIYETYSSRGTALKRALYDHIQRTEIFNLPDTYEKPQTAVTQTWDPLEQKPYLDVLKFNLWVPFAMNIPEFILGTTVMSRSLLGIHTLQTSGGWSIDDQAPIADILYRYAPGTFSLNLHGMMKSSFTQILQTQVDFSTQIMLHQAVRPTSYMSSAALFSGMLTYNGNTKIIGSGKLAWRWGQHAAPKEYYGNHSVNLLGGISLHHTIGNSYVHPIAVSSIGGQTPIFRTTQVVRLDIDAGISLIGKEITGFYPIGFDKQQKKGEASALITARYLIPFGVVDQPIPYGGIIGAGLALHGQTLVHSTNGSFSWEEDVYLGAQFNSTFAIGGAFTFQASGGVVLSVKTPLPTPIFSLQISTLFSNYGESLVHIQPEY